jgi:hypothetical protein
MTVRSLAVALGLPSSSASYVSQLEAGLKAPNPELAEKLANIFRDPQGIFRLWAMTGKRSDSSRAALARRQLARLLGDPSLADDPHFTHPALARIDAARESLMERRHLVTEIDVQRSLRRADAAASLARAAHSEAELLAETARLEAERAKRRHESDEYVLEQGDEAEDSVLMSRLESAEQRLAHFRAERFEGASPVRIPIVPEGTDPDRGESADPRAVTRGRGLRLDAEAVRALRLERPFAWQLTEAGVARVRTLLDPGDYVVITRDQGPVAPHEVYAVRHEHAVVLSLVMWNGRELLLLPDAGESDFVVLPADPDSGGIARHIVGHVATVVRGLDAETR